MESREKSQGFKKTSDEPTDGQYRKARIKKYGTMKLPTSS